MAGDIVTNPMMHVLALARIIADAINALGAILPSHHPPPITSVPTYQISVPHAKPTATATIVSTTSAQPHHSRLVAIGRRTNASSNPLVGSITAHLPADDAHAGSC